MNKSRKFLIVCLSVAVAMALFCGVFAVMGWGSLLRGVGHTVVYPFQRVFQWIGDGVSGFTSYFSDVDELQKEVESLREENDALRSQLIDMDILRDENRWLFDYLSMKEEHEDYALCAAEVISTVTAGGMYATRLTLNKGSVHGIEEGMPVVTTLGLLGMVTEVGLDHCFVRTVLDTSHTAGVITTRTGALGLLEGDYNHLYGGRAVLRYMSEYADVTEGDVIVTSGEGSIYPYGIPVGEVVCVSVNGYSRTTEAVIKPFARLDSVSQVMILTDYNRSVTAETEVET